MAWTFAIGNLADRAVRDPVAVSPAVGDTLLPLSHLSNGYPDEEASFTWRGDGHYQADLDLNLLAQTSSRADAPTGWRDYLLALAGTPGLPTNAPDWGTYGSRTALRLYTPLFQEIEVMPGEDVKLEIGLHLPAASTATGCRVRVIDTWSGKGWNGTAWASGGILDTQSSDDAWKDVAEEITADANRKERANYHVIVEPVAASYDATTYVYVSANGASGSPSLYAKASMTALIGHNIPVDATVTVGSESITLAALSCYATFTAKFLQTWRLDVQMPTGNQPRPIIGEVWIGTSRGFLKVPRPGIELIEGDASQIRVTGAQGRAQILSDQRVPNQGLKLEVTTTGDGPYEQYKNEITRGTRFGVDPILLMPQNEFDGAGRVIHARIGAVTTYKVSNVGWRSFGIDLMESPMSAAS